MSFAGFAGVRLVAVLALLTSCASASPSVAFKEPSEIAGTWRGRLAGRSGHAMAAMTIIPGGGFTSTMYLDGEDKDFSGAIVPVFSSTP